jgi:hypothetical protein
MPAQHLTTSTRSLGELSGGASLTPYIPHCAPNQFPRTEANTVTFPVQEPNVWRWVEVGDSTEGGVGIRLTFEVLGCAEKAVPDHILRRLLCCAVINRLSDDNVLRAFEVLGDLYVWQVRPPSVPQTERRRIIRATHVKRVERPALDFEDE